MCRVGVYNNWIVKKSKKKKAKITRSGSIKVLIHMFKILNESFKAHISISCSSQCLKNQYLRNIDYYGQK